jgi:drug/metabolite transporter (DMT)-like permease
VVRGALGQKTLEAPLRRADLPRFALAVLLGGAVAPALLLLGLQHTSASSGALLLNLEGVATMGIAWLIVRENVDRRLLIGAIAITAGAVLLSWSGAGAGAGGAGGDLPMGLPEGLPKGLPEGLPEGSPSAAPYGALLIALACLAWGVDNNLTRTLSSANPVQIAMLKGLVAGSTNAALALAMGAALPPLPVILGAAVVGFFGFGLSLVLFVQALRNLGAARTSAYFSTAPFIGAILAVMLFAEPVSATLLVAGALMALGVYLHLSESHAHEHVHSTLQHEHRHNHDEHHQHGHGADDPVTEPHSHWHRHTPVLHKHPHYPDLHHRHGHQHED